jgi:hypothetical protein
MLVPMLDLCRLIFGIASDLLGSRVAHEAEVQVQGSKSMCCDALILRGFKPTVWERHGLKPWIEAAEKQLHHNVLAIALANKLARIAWSVLARGRAFEARKMDQAANQSA